MSTHIIPIKVLAVLISFVSIVGQSASTDILITKECSRLEEQVTKGRETYILVSASGDKAVFSKNNIQQVSKQKTEENREIEKFRRSMLTNIQALKADILAARKETQKRQRQERKEATRPNEEAVAEAMKKVKHLRVVLSNMDISGEIGSEIYWGVGQAVPLNAKNYDYLGYLDGNVLVVTREGVERALAKAMREYRDTTVRSRVPMELSLHHHRELEEYDTVQELVGKTTKLCVKAIQAIQALTDETDLLKAEMAKWEKAVNDLIEKAYHALTQVRSGDWSAEVKPAEPIGFSTISSTNKPALSPRRRRPIPNVGKQNLVVVVGLSVSSEWFTPSREYYKKLSEEYGQLFSHSRRYRFKKALVFDSGRFKLILKDGQSFHPNGFIDPHTWGGDAVSGRYRLTFEGGGSLGFDGFILPDTWRGDVSYCAATRCITWYRRNPPPTIKIQICWVLDAKDCTPPFSLQLDNFEPVSVPDKRLELRFSQEPSSGGSSPRRSSGR